MRVTHAVQCYKLGARRTVSPAKSEMDSQRWKDENLCADASLDLQLSLPGVDHFQAASQLSLQVGEVAQFALDVAVKTFFRQPQLQRSVLIT